MVSIPVAQSAVTHSKNHNSSTLKSEIGYPLFHYHVWISLLSSDQNEIVVIDVSFITYGDHIITMSAFTGFVLGRARKASQQPATIRPPNNSNIFFPRNPTTNTPWALPQLSRQPTNTAAKTFTAVELDPVDSAARKRKISNFQECHGLLDNEL